MLPHPEEEVSSLSGLGYQSAANVEHDAEVMTTWLEDCVAACTREEPVKQRISWWNNILEDFKVRLGTLNLSLIHISEPTRPY